MMTRISSTFSVLLLVSLRFSAAGGHLTDRECGRDLRNLWLDVVFVIDDSAGMTSAGMAEVSANIATILGNGTTIGTGTRDSRSTRVGLVTYNSQATVRADLNMFESYDQLATYLDKRLTGVSDSADSFIAAGLEAAEEVLKTGSRDDVYQKMVIVYASTYQSTGETSPLSVAERLKSDGVTVSTVAVVESSDDVVAPLASISTPSFNFTTSSPNLVTVLQNAMLRVNCFCRRGWTQLLDASGLKFGVCLKTAEITANWIAAKQACHVEVRNGYLVNEGSQQKHDFVLELVKSNAALRRPYKYHIGLSYSNGVWSWEQPYGKSTRRLSPDDYTDWLPDFPVPDSTKVVVANRQTANNNNNNETRWENINRVGDADFYVCEVSACDTDNFCEGFDWKNE